MTRRILARSEVVFRSGGLFWRTDFFERGGGAFLLGVSVKTAFSVWCFDGGIVVGCGEFVVC